MKVSIYTFLFLAVLITRVAPAETDTGSDNGAIDWSNPSSIDPLRPGITDFLDDDLTEYGRAAYAAYRSGDYEEAARYFLVELRSDIGNKKSLYELARCYAMLGEEELAAKNLVRAVRAGYYDLDEIENDPDFDGVRDGPVFSAAVNAIREHIEAGKKGKGELLYFTGNSVMRGRIRLPEGYDRNRSYPLLVGLHGYGGHPDVFAKFYEVFDAPDFIFVTLQGPYPLLFGNEVSYSWLPFTGGNEEPVIEAVSLTDQYVMDAVADIRKDYKIGDVYLLGFSLGAYMTYYTGLKHHESFAGIIACSGYFPDDFVDDKDIAAAKTLPVYIMHGKDDRAISFEESSDTYTRLESFAYDVEFFEFAGGHVVPSDGLRKAQKWMNNRP